MEYLLKERGSVPYKFTFRVETNTWNQSSIFIGKKGMEHLLKYNYFQLVGYAGLKIFSCS